MLENNKNPRPASGRRKRGQTYEKSMEYPPKFSRNADLKLGIK